MSNYLTAETYIIESGIYENKTMLEAFKILLPKGVPSITRAERAKIWKNIQSEKRVDAIRNTYGVLSGFATCETRTKKSEHDYETSILKKQDWENRFD